jgi:hypothetical protein
MGLFRLVDLFEKTTADGSDHWWILLGKIRQLLQIILTLFAGGIGCCCGHRCVETRHALSLQITNPWMSLKQ